LEITVEPVGTGYTIRVNRGFRKNKRQVAETLKKAEKIVTEEMEDSFGKLI